MLTRLCCSFCAGALQSDGEAALLATPAQLPTAPPPSPFWRGGADVEAEAGGPSCLGGGGGGLHLDRLHAVAVGPGGASISPRQGDPEGQGEGQAGVGAGASAAAPSTSLGPGGGGSGIGFADAFGAYGGGGDPASMRDLERAVRTPREHWKG